MTKVSEKYDYDSTFPYRLRGLMEDRKVTQNKIAEVCNVTRQSVSQWQNGETRPDILALRKIAEYFNVSTDYLLGLTEFKTADKATKELCSTLGLSEEAVKILSADTSSMYMKVWENAGITDEAKVALMDGFSNDVRLVFNRMIEEAIEIHSNIELNTRYKPSLLEHLVNFFERVESKDAVILKTNYGTETHENTDDIETMNVSGSIYCAYDSKQGKQIIRPLYVKEVLVDSAINEIVSALNIIKHKNI